MLHRSPFQISNALPPNSPIFFGRQEELTYIKGRLRQGSILIVGSRRVGKTSLLNQVYHWARQQPDLLPIFLDIQGVGDRESFYRQLRIRLRAMGHDDWVDRDIRELADLAKPKHLVFLLNEIDMMVKDDNAFVHVWRSMNETGEARFVMVGYNTLNLIGDPGKLFFHFTQGTAYEGKALPLAQLSPASARQIPALLDGSDLDLQWIDPEERERAIGLLLDRSYRIPWVLQTYCQKLVERLHKDRRDVLSYKQVADLVKADHQSPVIWEYIDSIDYGTLRQGEKEKDTRYGIALKLLLYALARHLYFKGGIDAPIHDKNLVDREALAAPFCFTDASALGILNETMNEILFKDEFEDVKDYLRKLNLSQALRLLTLTFLIEPHPETNSTYGFLLHILPIELGRRHPKDIRLEDLVYTTVADLYEILKDEK